MPEPQSGSTRVRYASRPARTDTAGLLRLIGPAWLIVDVGLPRAVRERIGELAGHLQVLMITEEPAAAGRSGHAWWAAARAGPAC